MWRRTRKATATGPRWVIVAVARHQPEADLIVNLLHDGDIPAYHRRGRGFDVPDFLALGPREVMVPDDRAADARAVLDAPGWQAPPAPPSP
jgi:hypothetical protein